MLKNDLQNGITTLNLLPETTRHSVKFPSNTSTEIAYTCTKKKNERKKHTYHYKIIAFFDPLKI